MAQFETATFDEEDAALRRPPPELTTDLLEPGAGSRGHLVSRLSLARNSDTIDGPLVATFLPKLWLGPLTGFAVGLTVPMGVVELPGTDQFFLGNVRFSLMGSGSIALDPNNAGDRGPKIHLAAALDLILPTLTPPDTLCERSGACIGAERARGLHVFDPELFFPDAFFARHRGHLAFSIAGFRLAAELGLSTGVYVEGIFEGEGVALLDVAARASYDILDRVEPFIELHTMRTIDHPGGITLPSAFDPNATPLLVHFGARVYAGEIAPALFMTLDPDRSAFYFGFDFAGIVRSRSQRGDRQRLFHSRDP